MDALRAIPGIGSITDEYTQTPPDLPALVVSIGTEEYELGIGVEIVHLPFDVMGTIGDAKDMSQRKEDLVDAVIEKIDGISGYDIFLESTEFFPKDPTAADVFMVSGYMLKEKDFSNM